MRANKIENETGEDRDRSPPSSEASRRHGRPAHVKRNAAEARSHLATNSRASSAAPTSSPLTIATPFIVPHCAHGGAKDHRSDQPSLAAALTLTDRQREGSLPHGCTRWRINSTLTRQRSASRRDQRANTRARAWRARRT